MTTDDLPHRTRLPRGPRCSPGVLADPDVSDLDRQQVLCEQCGARVSLASDRGAAAAQITAFVAAHAGGDRSMSIRLQVN